MGQLFLRFVSIIFLIFEKGISKKLGYVLLRFVRIVFLITEKDDKQKIGPGFF